MRGELIEYIGSVSGYREQIKRALDILIDGAWTRTLFYNKYYVNKQIVEHSSDPVICLLIFDSIHLEATSKIRTFLSKIPTFYFGADKNRS